MTLTLIKLLHPTFAYAAFASRGNLCTSTTNCSSFSPYTLAYTAQFFHINRPTLALVCTIAV